MHKCIICGNDTENETIIGDAIIHLCGLRKCMGIFSFKIHGSFPVVWLSPDDVREDDLIPEKIITYYEEHPEQFVDIAHTIGDLMWENNLGETFHDALQYASENMVEDYISATPFDDLPLIINLLTTDKAKQLYKDRLETGK